MTDLSEFEKLGWSRSNVEHAKINYGRFNNNEIDLIDGEYLFLSWPGIHTYGHWLYDILPRIYLFKSVIGLDVDLILPKNLHANYYEMLDLFKISYKKINFDKKLKFEKLYVPGFTARGIRYPLSFSSDCYKHFGKNLTREIGDNKPCFVRHTTQTSIKDPRILDNERELIETISGFAKVISPAEHSITKQIELFSGKKNLAGVDSSAMHNLIFCDEGSKQMIISSSKRLNLIHSNISALKETNLYLNETNDNLDCIQANINFFVDFLSEKI
jgi:capsular polysaccharide biosynthesis protein